MTEVRARTVRKKGELNFENELRQALYAFGDTFTPLPETVRVLDELMTDFIIETCHTAARAATYSNRQKIKVDDFKFAIRRSEAMLGRVTELIQKNKEQMVYRKHLDDAMTEGRMGLLRGKGEKGGPRGRKRKRKERGPGKKGKEGNKASGDEEAEGEDGGDV